MNNKLTKNCKKIGVEEVRTADCAKLAGLPSPNAKPAARKIRITSTLVEVSTFCTCAARCTPRQLRIANAAIKLQASSCGRPNLNSHAPDPARWRAFSRDRKSTRLNSSHGYISYAVFCLKKKNKAHILLAPTEK